MATLGSYRADVQRLLHDASASYWSPADLNAFINEAIQRRDLDLVPQTTIQNLTLTAGQATYQFSALANPNIFDVLAISVLWNNIRVVALKTDIMTLNAFYRAWTTYTDFSFAFSKVGANTIYFAPTPNSAWVSEWCCGIFSATLVNDGDPDPAAYPYTDPVKFYACYLAKSQIGQYQEAQAWRQTYLQRVNEIQQSMFPITPDVYGGLFSGSA